MAAVAAVVEVCVVVVVCVEVCVVCVVCVVMCVCVRGQRHRETGNISDRHGIGWGEDRM